MSDPWTPSNTWGDEYSEAGYLLELRDKLRREQPWRAKAACAGMDPSLFYPEDSVGVSEARLVCSTCPVRRPCLDVGMGEEWGTWGGASQKARKRMRRGRAA